MLVFPVLGQPRDLGGDVSGIEIAAGQLAQPAGVDALRSGVALGAGSAIHPDQRRPQRPTGCVGRHQTIQLRSERDGPDRASVDRPAHLGQRLGYGAQPLARVLLCPSGPRIGQRVRDIGRVQMLAVGGQRLRAGSLRADVDTDHQLAAAHRSSSPSPGPRR
jgi:hypothetical protein